MSAILNGIHEANPNAEVVGFGYDTIFDGLGRCLIQKEIIPQCWSNKSDADPLHCFNTELVRIQEAWETLASTRPYAKAIPLTQLAGKLP